MMLIDKNKEYESHGYRFKNFINLSERDILMILDWRNHENVRRMMVNKDVISTEDHLRFVETLKDRIDSYYWLVVNPQNRYIGVLDLIHVNEELDQGEIGYYLNQEELGAGFEFMIECLYFVFYHLKLGRNLVTVNVKNRDIVLFNMFIGTVFEEKKLIGDEEFYVSSNANGDFIIEHYDELTLSNYARFVKKNRGIII